jgi:hypothetical protein
MTQKRTSAKRFAGTAIASIGLLMMWFGCRIVFAQTPAPESAPRTTTFAGRPAIVVSNDKLEMTIALLGGAFAKLLRKDDPNKLSPLWDPAEAARAAGLPAPTDASLGHFVCVDGFGVPSDEEQKAGFPTHGEAHERLFEISHLEQQSGAATLTLKVNLPITQETFSRSIRMALGENAIYVTSELESHLGFDRPISWAEHATIGAPFLEPDVTVLDVSSKSATTRPYPPGDAPTRRFTSGEAFTWPNIPAQNGGTINGRSTPPMPPSTEDMITVVLGSQHNYAFITMVNRRRHALFGYLVRPSDYPWMQDWEYYSNAKTVARGLEFSTQPYGMPRRQVVEMHDLLNTPTFRWLSAKSKLETRFIMFYTQTPDGFGRVSDIDLKNGKLIIVDRESNQTIEVGAAEAGAFLGGQ